MSQQINLFNPLLRKQKKYFSAFSMALGLAGVVLGMVAFYAYSRQQVGNLGASAAATAKRLESEQSSLTRVQKELEPNKKGKLLESQIAQAETQLAARQRVLGVLQGGDLGNTAGFSEYLRAYARQAIDGLWLTGFTIHGAGNQMVLEGRAVKADLVPAYIRRLNQEKVMQGKDFAAMEVSLPAPVKPEGAAAKDAPPPLPRFVEFRLMSAEREADR